MKNNFKKWCQTFAALAILQVSAENLPEKKEKNIMKYAKIMLGGFLAITGAVNAMPTQEQVKQVQPLVLDLMKDDQVALKSGKKTRVEVAESAIALADKADSEAAKLLLMKGAFNLYVRAGEFDKAIETLQALQSAIPDMPPANMAGIIETALRVVPRKNGGQLYRLLDETKTRMRYTSAAKKMEKTLKESPNDRQLRTKLAEHYAYLGKWDKALENFIAADGKAGAIAKAEQGGEAGEKAADFWWTYPTGKADELVKAFRTHAAKLYEDAIADGKITGLNKVQAERRIEETKEYGENIFEAAPEASNGLYCVIDLTGGRDATTYPVSYLKSIPNGGWSDVYKTSKMVFRRIESGTFQMGSGSSDPRGIAKVRITKPYYIGVFEVTQRQCELIQGWASGSLKGNNKYPVCGIAYRAIRGAEAGSRWPKSNDVDRNSILGHLRTKTGLAFDLPTEAQWEYACRAGTKTDFSNGKDIQGKDKDPSLDKLACYGNGNKFPSDVGSYQPNAWGLYDVHGNVNEWCRDWFGPIVDGTDPKGAKESSSGRVIKSGAWWDPAYQCASHMRGARNVDVNRPAFGFRLSIDVGAKAGVVMPYAVSADFNMDAKAGTVTALKVSDDCKVEFVMCPSGEFKMGYTGAEKIAPLRDVTITRPFWISKRKITKRQFAKVGVPSEDRDVPADMHDPVKSVEKFTALMNEKYGKILPRGYVFRIATEAEYEYVSKAGAKKGDHRLEWGYTQENDLNPWGVEDLLQPGSKLVFQDRVPSNESKCLTPWADAPGDTSATRMVAIDYSKQPTKDPLMWCDTQGSRYLRRELSAEAKKFSYKLTAAKDGFLCGSVFYLVAAPSVESLNKFLLK